MLDWFIYPVRNYSKILLSEDSNTYKKDVRELCNNWKRLGTIRSFQLVLLAHESGTPHVLLLKPRGNDRWSLPIEYAESGGTDSVMVICSSFDLLGICQ